MLYQATPPVKRRDPHRPVASVLDRVTCEGFHPLGIAPDIIGLKQNTFPEKSGIFSVGWLGRQDGTDSPC